MGYTPLKNKRVKGIAAKLDAVTHGFVFYVTEANKCNEANGALLLVTYTGITMA